MVKKGRKREFKLVTLAGHTWQHAWQQHLVTPGNTMPTEHFCLKWNNYQTNIVSALGNLKLDGDFVDVTLSCEGRKIEAHKVILSACSDYFRDVFRVSEKICSIRTFTSSLD